MNLTRPQRPAAAFSPITVTNKQSYVGAKYGQQNQ